MYFKFPVLVRTFYQGFLFTQVFAATCPKDAKLVTGGNYQVNILKAHNRVRNDIALATATGFESAMRMATVVSITQY